MKAEIVRISKQCWDTAYPKFTADNILQAEGFPGDAKIIHILFVENKEQWEILIGSQSYPDRSISELANSNGMNLVYNYTPEMIDKICSHSV